MTTGVGRALSTTEKNVMYPRGYLMILGQPANLGMTPVKKQVAENKGFQWAGRGPHRSTVNHKYITLRIIIYGYTA